MHDDRSNPFLPPSAEGYIFVISSDIRYVSSRAYAPRLALPLMLAVCLMHSIGSEAQTVAAPERVSAAEVLVLFNASWPDEDGNGRSDSQDVAEYYAARRGIPSDHLLGLALTARTNKPDQLEYPDF